MTFHAIIGSAPAICNAVAAAATITATIVTRHFLNQFATAFSPLPTHPDMASLIKYGSNAIPPKHVF
jgi:hypothetical protein